MVNITLYKFTKEYNSTKRPTGGTSFNCEIKKGSGLMNPAIELNIGLANAPDYNYCYIPDFNRYYYVIEWFFDAGFWTATLQCDVLATYRTEIGDTSLYALRSSANWDGTIVDGYYPTKTGCTFEKTAINNLWTNTAKGMFVVGIVGKEPDYGSINYYAMNQPAFARLMDELMDDSLFNNFTVDGVSKDMIKNIADPLQYIKSCVYIPLPLSPLGDPTPVLKIWNWDINILYPIGTAFCFKLKKSKPYEQIANIQVTIPKHPQASQRGTFLNSSPYSIYTLAVPPFGVIDIDSSVVNNQSTLTLKISVDYPTGLGILSVYAGNSLINRMEAMIGVDVVLSQVTRDYIGGASAILSGIGSVAGMVASLAFPPAGLAGGALAAFKGATAISGASGAGGAIGSAITALTPRSQSMGTGGSYGQLYQEAGLYAQFFQIVDDDLAKNGRPCCKVLKPKNNSGYLLIQDADVKINGTLEEAASIQSYLESGFYWE